MSEAALGAKEPLATTRPKSWREAYRQRKHLKFTREGKYYVAFTFGVGLAALNTGNNLLFLVLGLQLTAILVSGVLSEICLDRLEIERAPAPDPVAGEPCAVAFRVRNGKRFWPSFTLTVAEKEGPFAGARASALVVPPGDSTLAVAQVTPQRRGRFASSGVRVATRFPFGFFEKWQDVEARGEVYVLPARVRAGERLASGGQRDGERPQGRAGHGAEFHGLRELRPGDDRRLVHWRKSAAVGRLLVIEREREQRRRVVVLLDNRGPAEGAWLEGPVRAAAAVARKLSQRDLEVGLAASGVYLAPGAGPAALKRILRALAALEPAPASAAAPDAHREGALRIPGGGAP